jgi:arsenite methyltransferase
MDSNLYAQQSFRQAAGCEFRPGGMDLTRELAAACPLRPGDRVLDLGCGVGATASYLSREHQARVTGLDVSPDFLDEARRSDPTVEWVQGRADSLPFPDGSFDVVFAECFLSAFADGYDVLSEARRVLRPGGRLAVSDMYLREPGAARAAERAAAAAAAALATSRAGAAPAPSALLAPAGPAASQALTATCLRGAGGKEETLAALEQAGFYVQLWQDRSDTLKALMASLIMTYGSAAAFWEAACGCAPGGSASSPAGGCAPGGIEAMRAGRPGYYLLIAEVGSAASTTATAEACAAAPPAGRTTEAPHA